MLKKALIFTVASTVMWSLVYSQATPKLTFSPTTLPDGQYGSAYARQTIKVTGGKPPYSFSVSAGSLPSGLVLSPDGVISGIPSAAGSYSFTVSVQDKPHGPGKGSGDASGSQQYTLVIARASLVITAKDAAMTYGGALPPLTISYAGFAEGDNSSSLATQPTVSTSATRASGAGTYPITPKAAADPNYTFTYSPGTLTISAASLLVNANGQTKKYGSPDPAFTYTVTGFGNNDNSSIFSGSLGRTQGEAVGDYPIKIGSLSAGSNYSIRFVGNSLTITTASQKITWAQSLSVGCNATTQLPLTAVASSGLPVTYSVSDTTIATVSGNVLTLRRPGAAIVTAIQAGDANYSAAPAVTDTVSYQSASLITQHWSDAIFFDNASGDFIAWQWYKNDSLLAGATGPYYSETPSLNGQYFVIATDKEGQQIQSCTLTISGTAPIPGGIRVYPNPAYTGAQVLVSSNYPSTALQKAVIQLVDIGGKVRQQITNIQPSMQVTLPGENGMFIINLLLANGTKASTNVLVIN